MNGLAVRQSGSVAGSASARGLERAVAMVSDVIALPSDSFSGLNQVSGCLGLLRRSPRTDANKFTPSFFILLVVNIPTVSCCRGCSYLRPLSKPLF